MRATCNGAQLGGAPAEPHPGGALTLKEAQPDRRLGPPESWSMAALLNMHWPCAPLVTSLRAASPRKKIGALLANKVILHSSGHAAARSAQLPRLLAGRRLTIFDSSLPLLGTMCTRDPPDLESVDTRARLSKPPLSRPERRIASRPSPLMGPQVGGQKKQPIFFVFRRPRTGTFGF